MQKTSQDGRLYLPVASWMYGSVSQRAVPAEALVMSLALATATAPFLVPSSGWESFGASIFAE